MERVDGRTVKIKAKDSLKRNTLGRVLQRHVGQVDSFFLKNKTIFFIKGLSASQCLLIKK